MGSSGFKLNAIPFTIFQCHMKSESDSASCQGIQASASNLNTVQFLYIQGYNECALMLEGRRVEVFPDKRKKKETPQNGQDIITKHLPLHTRSKPMYQSKISWSGNTCRIGRSSVNAIDSILAHEIVPKRPVHLAVFH